MAVRTVTGPLGDANGSPRGSFLLRFYMPATYTADQTLPTDTAEVTTDETGEFTTTLVVGVVYEVQEATSEIINGTTTTVPRGSRYPIVVPEGEGSISLATLQANSSPVNTTPTALQLVQDTLDTAIAPLTAGLALVNPLVEGTDGQTLSWVDDGPGWTDPSEVGESIFFLEDEVDPVIATYKVMDNPAQLTAEAFVTQATVTDGALVQAWITDVGLPGTTFIPAGAWQFHINAYKTGGSKETRLYNEMYKRDVGGTETLLGTTATSIPLTDSEAVLPTFNIYIDALTLLATDRLVTKTRIALVGGGSNPASVTVGYSGTTAARLALPSQAVDVTQFVRTSGEQDVEGVKTFAASPIIPTPTTDLQAATKAYVDQSGIAGSLAAWSVGNWVYPGILGPLSGAAASTLVMSTTAWWSPISLTEVVTIDAMAVSVTTEVAGATIRLGLFTLSGDTLTLVQDGGTIDASTPGIKVATITPYSPPVGQYWLGCVASLNGVSVTATGAPVGFESVEANLSASNTVNRTRIKGGQTALAAGWGGSVASTTLSTNNPARVAIRRSA